MNTELAYAWLFCNAVYAGLILWKLDCILEAVKLLK